MAVCLCRAEGLSTKKKKIAKASLEVWSLGEVRVGSRTALKGARARASAERRRRARGHVGSTQQGHVASQPGAGARGGQEGTNGTDTGHPPARAYGSGRRPYRTKTLPVRGATATGSTCTSAPLHRYSQFIFAYGKRAKQVQHEFLRMPSAVGRRGIEEAIDQ